MIEDITEQKRTDALLQNDNQILEMITSAAQFSDILEAIVKNIELLSNNALCSILLLDEDGIHLRHGAASSLPEDYNCAIDGMAIGENTGSCGTAAYRKEVVIVSDIASDPSWINYRELALKHGLKACWSTPITDVHGRVLGTFAMYYLEPRLPEPFDLKLIERATHQATIVIERNQADNKILRINADLVRSETRERLARETAEHTSELKSKFLDIAAHELRTPITAFSLLLQITQRSLENGQPVEVITLVRLRSQAIRIGRLVIDLLDVSRLERGLTVLQKVPTNIVSLISECIIEYQLLEPTRQFNFLSLDDGFDKSEAKVLDIDPVRINQVLTNLLDNAAKYTPKDSPIEVMITKLPNTLHVSVIDHGAGISPEHQKKLFTAFSRGKSDTVTKSAGLGLGLFICRAIIDLHLGTIGVLSEEGKGSTFYFELPRKAI